MINFRVEDLGQDRQRVSLRDEHGQLHVARLNGAPGSPAPDVGDALFGQEPQLGARVLVQQLSNKPLSVHFEALGCTQSQALDLLHPLPAVPVHPTSGAAPGLRRGEPERAGPSLD